MNIFDRRLRAFSIDTSLAGVLVFALIPLQQIPSQTRLYLAVLIYFGVFCFPDLLGKGQSFGKRIQKICVIYNTNELVPTKLVIPNRFYLFLRDFVKCLLIIITFGFYVIIGGIVASNRQDGRSIHDLIFKTRVVALTKYVSDGVELNRGETANKVLEGYGPDEKH